MDSNRLRALGLKSAPLHGEMSQRERDEALQSFRAGQSPVLLTSELGARGLDIPRLPAVVNFDPPATASQYVHRAGRTGRQGASGLVVTLVRADAQSARLASQLRRAGCTDLPPALLAMLPSLPGHAPGKPPTTASTKKRKQQGGTGGSAGGVAAGGLGDLLSFAQAAAGSGTS